MIMCNVCGKYKAVEYVNFKGTHIHNCRFCPNVQVEYSLPTDMDNLKEFLGIKERNGLEMIDNMRRAAVILMSKIQMGISYSGWSKEFANDEIVGDYRHVKDMLKEKIGDVLSLSVDELLAIGFIKGGDDSDLYLIPLWVYDFIPEGTELITIFGITKTKGKDDIDLDTRFGCMSYGIYKSQK